MFISNVVIRLKYQVEAENEKQAKEIIWDLIDDIDIPADTDDCAYLDGYDEIESIERVD